jgi:hypothetical protein
MTRRLFAVCVRAYPRAVRRVDGRYLRDLALTMSEERGVARQAWSLLTGALRAHIIEFRRRPQRSRLVVAGATAFAALTLLVAVAGTSNTEIEVRSCVDAAAQSNGCTRS